LTNKYDSNVFAAPHVPSFFGVQSTPAGDDVVVDGELVVVLEVDVIVEGNVVVDIMLVALVVPEVVFTVVDVTSPLVEP